MLKHKIIIFAGLLALLGMWVMVEDINHRSSVVLGAPTSTIVQNLVITGIKPAVGTTTLSIDSNGLVGTTTITAGSGGGVASSGSPTTNDITYWTGTNSISGSSSFRFGTNAYGGVKVLVGTSTDPTDSVVSGGVLSFLVSGENPTFGTNFGAWTAATSTGKPTFFGIRSRGSFASPTQTLSGDSLFHIDSTGFKTDNTVFATDVSTRIAFVQDGDSGASFVPGRINFWTTDDAGSFGQRMTIRGNGLVGINTSNPSSSLHVNGDLIVQNTTTIRGRLQDASGNAYVTSTSASATITVAGVTFTTPFTFATTTGISIVSSSGNITFGNTGVLSFNGATGAITGVNSVNGATGTVTFGYVSSLNGSTGTYNLYAGGILSIATGTGSSTISLTTTTLNTQVAALGYVTSTSGSDTKWVFNGTVLQPSSTATAINASGTPITLGTTTWRSASVASSSRDNLGVPSFDYTTSSIWITRLQHSFNNFLNNSSFEHWFEGTVDVAPTAWTVQNATTSRVTTSSVGTYAVEFEANANDDNIYQVISANTSVWYTCSVYYKRISGTGTASIVLQENGGDFTEYANVDLSVYTTTTWNLALVSAQKPDDGTSQVRCKLAQTDNTATETVWYFDEVMFQEGRNLASAWLPKYVDDTYDNQEIYGSKIFRGVLNASNTVNFDGTVNIRSNSLLDASGNAYVTSTTAGSGTVTTSSAVTAGYFPFWTGDGALSGTSTVFRSGLNVGIGTSSPTEILQIWKGTGEFTTIRFDSAATQGYFFAYDGDNSVNIGSNSNSQLNFRVNNSNVASLLTNGGFQIGTIPVLQQNGSGNLQYYRNSGSSTIFNIVQNSADPLESTITLFRDYGSNNSEFFDIYSEHYENDFSAGLVSAASGTGQIAPVKIWSWRADQGTVASSGLYWALFSSPTSSSNGNIGFNLQESELSTNSAIHVAASSSRGNAHAANILRLDSEPGTTRFLFTAAGRLGVGTTSPASDVHLYQGTGGFTTLRADSGATQGYFWAYDGDDSVNIGSNSDSQLNLKVNNTTILSFDKVLNNSEILFTDSTKTATTSAVGNYLTRNAGSLDVDPELASSSVSFTFYDATSTAPYKFQKWRASKTMTITAVSCDEYAAATTTVQLYRASSIATTTNSQTILASIACGINGTSTTSFTSSTLPVDTLLIANTTSTAGTPTLTTVNVYFTTND